jgi:protein-S-isoprenylcysteine O-methyltransferase Ste14
MKQKNNKQFTSLDEFLKKLGNAFFRWRSYIPLILLPILILRLNDLNQSFANQHLEIIYQAFCLLISFSGEFVRIITIGFVPSGTSGRNTKAQRATALNTTGMYSITRNPLYLGNFLIILGVSVFTRSWQIVLINCILFLLFYVPIILVEESFLLTNFGDKYKEYLTKAPCFFPRFNLWNSAENDWSWGMVIRREYSSIFSTTLSFVIIAHIRIYAVHNDVMASPTWLVIGGVFSLMWLTMRILRLLRKL